MPATHVRQQIRMAMVALVKDSDAVATESVYSGRARSLVAGNLPAVDVDFGRFEGRPDGGPIHTDESSDASRLLERLPILTLAVTVAMADGHQDAIDAVFLMLEPAIAEDNTLAGLVARITPIGEPRLQFVREGAELAIARAEMPFEVVYVTAFNDPSKPA